MVCTSTMSRQIAAARPAGHLGQQLKGALGRAEIRHAQADVGGHDAHQRDVRNVVSLGDHLRAHEDVVAAFAKAREDRFEVPLAGDGVAIEPRDARLRRMLGAVRLPLAPSPMPRK